MERINERAQSSDDPNGRLATCPLMRPKARAYSHQGHGPRADQQAGYISATSETCAELTSIHSGHKRTFESCRRESATLLKADATSGRI